MRIAHFIQRYPPAIGGSEAYFARLSQFLGSVGDRVTVYTTNALDLSAFWSPKGRCLRAAVDVEGSVEIRRYGLLRWPARRWFLKPVSLVPYRPWQCLTLPCNPIAPGMWRDAGRAEPRFDIVHATTFPYAFPISCGLRLARSLKAPFVITPFMHLGDPNDQHDRVRRQYTTPALLSLVRAADAVFVQTTSERDMLLSLGIRPEVIVLLGMGVDPSEATGGNRECARRNWGASETDVIVGHLANNSREKGSIDLVRAAKKLWDRGTRFRLVLAGPEMPNFIRFWARHAPDKTIQRLGIIDDAQKRDFFAGIDVFALPSRSDSFGLVLLEAWANGVPNVGYRAGGIADVIRHEVDGILTPCGDIVALSFALDRLINDSSLRRRMGAAGQARIHQEFQWQDKLQRVRGVYQTLTGR